MVLTCLSVARHLSTCPSLLQTPLLPKMRILMMIRVVVIKKSGYIRSNESSNLAGGCGGGGGVV